MEKNKQYTICIIPGDGIGPDVIGETIKLLEATKVNFSFIYADAGFGVYEKLGTPLPDETITKCKKSDAILFGAVTTPPNIPNYFSPIVKLRKVLDTYANIRPFFSLPLQNLQQEIDFVIFRENTEDLYSGKERITREGAVAERIITKKASKQIITAAFEFAKKEKRKKVTIVHKANVLRLTDGLFLKIGYDIAKKYPEIQCEDMLVDATAMRLVKHPEHFDVVVTTNMFGDILSDEAAALAGGLGIVASANVGEKYALFEPVHGSAPKYAGKNVANPLACFFAASMLFDYLGEQKVSKKIKKAILKTLHQKYITKDLGGKSSMSEFTEKVIENFKSF